ncbi:MAG: S-layer protein [Candidatus Micrarchaeota archaeon]|nr:S-layer protein [Candidatus Micrarchaeota archaeon]
MKTLNAKRIAAVVAGAALLGVGLAFAGSITFQNVPIISNSGQPVVQVVIGSSAKPADGVTAANIAAAIGNLAYTSVPVTATVNQTQANKVLSVSVSSSSYSLSNQQVWLNESGSVSAAAGTYLFSALIGSVLNGAVILNSPQNTKQLQGSGQYTYPHSTTIAISPVASPYTTAGFVPISTSVTASNNGGGTAFSQFTSGSNDNIMQVTSSQYSGLASNYGGNSETEYLWLTGFPVFNQGSAGSPVNQFEIIDAGGAYQATFGAPIQNSTTSNAPGINVPIRLLGQNWTILNATGPQSTITSASTVAGGKLYLAAALVPLQTLYVGHNITSGPWTVQLTDLGQPNSNGVSPASLSVMYNNVLTNTSSVSPGTTAKFNVTGHTLYVNVNATFAGLYAYQKWAKMQLYTNVYKIQNGKQFNATTNPGWYVNLLWTNTTSSTSASAKALQSIIIYNSTPTTLSPGQSFSFIQNPQLHKLTFLGDTLGSSSFDSVTLGTSSTSSVQYQNSGTNANSITGLTIKNVTEAAQELTVTSQIPNAFSYVGQTASSVVYDLTPYKLTELANQISPGAASQVASAGNQVSNSFVTLAYTNVNAANWITTTNPLLITVSGFTSNTASSAVTQTLTFTGASYTQPLPTNVFNVTGVQINRALPGALAVSVGAPATAGGAGATNSVTLAILQNVGSPGVLYTQSGQVYQSLSLTAPGNVIYNQQNGQPTNTFVLAAQTTPTGPALGQYFTYTLGEQAVPSNSAAVDGFVVGIDNSTAGIAASPLFQLNYSSNGGSATASGTRNNATYQPSSLGSTFNVQAGFRTEKGSKLVSITPSLVTFGLAKAQDYLQFSVSSVTSNTPTKNYKLYGPYGVGQATNIPNVSIGPVNATIKVSGANFTISGIANLTATPSVATATQPVLLKNLTTTPLVVLDSQASPGSNLILIGSGFVNTLSGQLQSAYNISMTPTTQITQAYGTNRVLVAGYYANQTAAAGNSFIQQLYAQAQ